jgi:hypothetical protein
MLLLLQVRFRESNLCKWAGTHVVGAASGRRGGTGMTAEAGTGGCGKTSAVACPAGREGPHLKDRARAAAACTTRAGRLTAASTRAATAGDSPGAQSCAARAHVLASRRAAPGAGDPTDQTPVVSQRGGGLGGYQRGGRPMEGRGGPVGMPAMMGPPRVGPDDRNQPVDRYGVLETACRARAGASAAALARCPRTPGSDAALVFLREKQCPMLIRIFCKFGEHHRDEEFSYTQQPVEDEVCESRRALCALGPLRRSCLALPCAHSSSRRQLAVVTLHSRTAPPGA